MPATKKKKSKTPTVNVVLATFDARPSRPVYRRLRDGALAEFEPIGPHEYAPHGMTPLLDACASFIGELDGARHEDRITIGLLMDESGSMKPNRQAVLDGVNEFVDGMREVAPDPAAAGKVLAVIATDGVENQSRETSLETLRQMFAEREADGFTFIFIGADQDAWDSARSLGLSGGATGQSISSVNTPQGTAAAFRGLATRGVGYVGDHGSYAAQSVMASNIDMAEDGTETVRTEAPDPAEVARVQASIAARGNAALADSLEKKAESPYSAKDALERAAESTRSPGAS